MALWFVSYATSPIIVIVYDISIVIFYDVTLLYTLSMMFQFQSLSGEKTDWLDLWVIKPTNQVSTSSGFRVPHYHNMKERPFKYGNIG